MDKRLVEVLEIREAGGYVAEVKLHLTSPG